MYGIVKSLEHTPDMNIALYVNYTEINKIKKKKKRNWFFLVLKEKNNAYYLYKRQKILWEYSENEGFIPRM